MLTDTFVNPSEHRPVVQLFVQVKQVFFREDDPQTAAGTIWVQLPFIYSLFGTGTERYL